MDPSQSAHNEFISPLTSQHFVWRDVWVRDDELDAADLPVELDGVLQVVLVLVADRPELRVLGQHLRVIKIKMIT